MKKVFLIIFLFAFSIFAFSKVYISENYVVFEYKDLTASKVFLAGSFNNWDSGALEMEKIGGGIWRVSLKLSPGDYQYKFVINGTDWKEDPEAPDYVPDGYGGKNGAFTLVLGNGSLKIKKTENQKNQENNLFKGEYYFNLKSKIDMDTYSFKMPEINHNFYLIMNPKKSGMDLEVKLSSDNYSWQFKLDSLKVVWENSEFAFGVFKNTKVNELINFSENIETNNTGFFGVLKTEIFKAGIDVYSQNNELRYMISSGVNMNNIKLNALYLPGTENSTMNIYARAEAFNFGLEIKYTTEIEYLKGNYSNDFLEFNGIYNFKKGEIALNSNFDKMVYVNGEYSLEDKAYNIESDIIFEIKPELKLLFDIYYDNLNNIGYKAGIGIDKKNMNLSLKVGHDFSKDFKEYYLFIFSSASF